MSSSSVALQPPPPPSCGPHNITTASGSWTGTATSTSSRVALLEQQLRTTGSLRDAGPLGGEPVDGATAGEGFDLSAPQQSPPNPGAAFEMGSTSPEDVKPLKKAGKRGRKKKEDEVLPSDGEMDINLKRKLQNRGAQRAFRERKEKHLADLEARVVEQAEQLEAFRTLCERLHAENHALRRGEAVPSTELPSAPPSFATDSAAPLPAASEAPPAVDLTLPPLPPPSQPFTFQSLPQPLPQPAHLHAGPTPFPSIPTYEMAPSNPLPPPTQSTVRPNTPLDVDMLNMDMNFDFDFDAPVDLDAAVPLPPFLQDLFDSFGDGGMGLGMAAGAVGGEKLAVPQVVAPRKFDTEVEEGDDVCPGDEDDVAPLTAENMPCPECDFSVVSCALPLPWRPPTIGKDVASKDVWVSQKAWAKLCSHPLFSQCDVNELCTLLRDNTRCSDDGRLVISKADVCEVFRSIPARARVKREQDEMRR